MGISCQRGIPSKRKSAACVDYIPALCDDFSNSFPENVLCASMYIVKDIFA